MLKDSNSEKAKSLHCNLAGSPLPQELQPSGVSEHCNRSPSGNSIILVNAHQGHASDSEGLVN